jgi:hypothetical protein
MPAWNFGESAPSVAFRAESGAVRSVVRVVSYDGFANALNNMQE